MRKLSTIAVVLAFGLMPACLAHEAPEHEHAVYRNPTLEYGGLGP